LPSSTGESRGDPKVRARKHLAVHPRNIKAQKAKGSRRLLEDMAKIVAFQPEVVHCLFQIAMDDKAEMR
jgi:hypothetical protein